MGIISSIFGERPSAPQTGGFTVGAEIPKELAPFYKDILGKSQALYNESVSRGYEPYTGPSLAEFTPEQQQAFTGIAGLQGQQAPVYQEAMGMTRDAAAPITTEQIEEYMNPYQQAVVDIEKREAQKQYQSQVVPQLAAKAAMAQPFGGSRQAILEGMAADTQQRLLGDIQAKGSAQAYQDAVNLVQNQRDRLGSGAGQLATLGSNQFKSQLGEIGALQTVGEEKQQLAQQALNEAYGQYVKEQEFPFQQLGRYQSVVTGAPIQQTQYVPPTPPGPSVGQQLLGGAATMLGTYGAFGGKMPQLFGSTPAKTGGGIGDLPVIKAQNNTYLQQSLDNMSPINLRQSIKNKLLEDKLRQKYLNNFKYNFNDPLPEDYGETVDEFGGTADAREKYLRQRNKILRDEQINTIDSLSRMSPPPDNVYEDDSGLEVYKKILMKNRPDLNLSSGKNNTSGSGQNIVIGDDSRGPLKALIDQITPDTSGIQSIIKNKYQDIKTNRRDNQKEITKKYNKLLEEKKINPFSDKNKPPMFAEKTDVRPDSPAKQDLEKVLNFGGKIVGSGVDLLNKGNNWINKNMNNLLKIGETYVLKPGDKSGITELPIRTNEEARELFNKYNFGGRDIPTTVEEQKELDEKINTVDMRPGRNEGLIVEAERILKNPEIITESNAVDKIKELYGKMTSGVNKLKDKAAEKKTENLLERPVPPKQLKNLNKKPVKTITAINNNDTSLNKSITKNEDKVVETNTNYGNIITKKEQGDKVSKTDLTSAQDKYLEAVEKMNKGLDKKDALIGKAQQESFWAFVARVGANISKGAGISESVAAELPQAMKDRKSLIQAKSDLEDKKLAGQVDVAKAGLDVEKSRTSARIATEKEKQRRIEVLRDDKIAFLRAKNTGSSSDRSFKLPTNKEIEAYTDITSDILNGIANGSKDLSTYFNATDNINITGVNNQEDLNSAFKLLSKNKTFMTDLATYLENAKLSEDYLLNMDSAISLGIKNVLADNKYSYNKEKGIIKLFDKEEITKR